ncbi:MAG: hypothetical protein GY739_00080, partial [Mesoflavibacter sp.]|nr:hypothetical protein [Mesoflavibacter sp.]
MKKKKKKLKKNTKKVNLQSTDDQACSDEEACSDEQAWSDAQTWIEKVWDADKIPTEEELKNADTNIYTAVFRWLLMRGIRPDPTKEPTDFNQPKMSDKEILDKWNKNMDPTVPIHICGMCGRQDIMSNEYVNPNTEYDYKLMDADDIAFICEANEKEIAEKSKQHPLHRQALHLTKIKGKLYHLVEQGVQENDKVMVCKVCVKALQHAKKKNKAPIHTIANYDLGKIPDKLKKFPLNMVETMALSTGHLISPVLHFKSINKKCVKGHAYGIKMKKDDVLNSITDILPRCDLDLKINIVIFGEGNMRKIAEKHIQKNFLKIRMPRVMLWLHWLKNIG